MTEHVIRKQEAPPCGSLPKLGRLSSVDVRDKRYRVRVPEGLSARRSRYWMFPEMPDDQGATSQCVAFSWVHWLKAAPIRQRPKVSQAEIYRKAQDIDEWPGNAYDGTSVRAGAKVLQEAGAIREYRWAFTIDEVVQTLLEHGPMVVGTDWRMDMFRPDAHGYIQPMGQTVGGHAYLLIGVNRGHRNPDGSTGRVRILNSWGSGWAKRGRAWISIEAFEALLRAGGEACIATEARA